VKAQVGGFFRAPLPIFVDHQFHDQQVDEGAKLERLAPSF
jgi:hypothetical protein